VLAATAMYNQPDKPTTSEFLKKNHGSSGGNGLGKKGGLGATLGLGLIGERKNHYHDSPLNPVEKDAPILGQLNSKKHLSWTDSGGVPGLPSGFPSPSPVSSTLSTHGPTPTSSPSTKDLSPPLSKPPSGRSDTFAYPPTATLGSMNVYSPDSQRPHPGVETRRNPGWRND